MMDFYYGPFAQAGLLRSTLSEMRKKFGILLNDAKPVNIGKRRWRLMMTPVPKFSRATMKLPRGVHSKGRECMFIPRRKDKGWLSDT